MSNANNPNPPAAVVEHDEEYQRLDRVFDGIAWDVSQRSRLFVSIETDGAMDEPATVTIRVYGVDWARAEEELEESLRDILSAMEAKRGVK